MIGVGVSGFASSDTPVQLELFDQNTDTGKDWERVDRTVEKISEKFGSDAIKRATLQED